MSNKLKQILGLLLALIMALALAACSPAASVSPTPAATEAPVATAPAETPAATEAASGLREVTDTADRVIELPETLTRIAAPAGTEYTMMMVLGRDQDVIATNQYMASNAWMVLVSPSVVDCAPAFGQETNIETLTQSNPEVILSYAADSSIPLYENAGLTYYMMASNDTRDTVKQGVIDLGEILGEQERAEAYATWYDEKTEMLHTALADITDEDRPSVLFLYTFDENQTFNTVGSGMAQTSDMADAGGVNVAVDSVESFGAITVEQIAQWDPEYIIYNGTADTMEAFKATYPSLQAVKNGNVYLQPGGVWGWSGISVENILEPLFLAKILYPDRFTDLDIGAEVKYFYETFYDFTLTDAQLEAILANEAPPAA